MVKLEYSLVGYHWLDVSIKLKCNLYLANLVLVSRMLMCCIKKERRKKKKEKKEEKNCWKANLNQKDIKVSSCKKLLLGQ